MNVRAHEIQSSKFFYSSVLVLLNIDVQKVREEIRSFSGRMLKSNGIVTGFAILDR